jgi:D-aspartate ligase
LIKNCAVVLGGYVNGYSIIQELHSSGVNDLVLIEYGDQLAGKSNKLKQVIPIAKTKESLLKALQKLHESYEFLVLFPSDDLQLELLKKIEVEIKEFCFLPFNSKNIIQSLDKYYQYEACERLGVPYPKTLNVESVEQFKSAKNLLFPLLIKPNTRKDLEVDIFRNLQIKSPEELEKQTSQFEYYFEKGLTFLISEIVPGNTNGTIHTYVAYISKSKQILNSWIGQKLTQFPDDYGVFSSGSNQSHNVVESQGRALVEGMGLEGIVQPEFKYDPRDDKYKLMEINLRSMMWHRVGNLSGVKLQYSQWLDATNQQVPKFEQERVKTIHFAYLKHELSNLLRRKGYYSSFKTNLFKGDMNYIALADSSDLKPFLFDLYLTARLLLKELLFKKRN